MLSIGYASGVIECFILTPESNKFKLFTTSKSHKKRVVGVQSQGIKSTLVSISRDNIMMAHDISQEESYKSDGRRDLTSRDRPEQPTHVSGIRRSYGQLAVGYLKG